MCDCWYEHSHKKKYSSWLDETFLLFLWLLLWKFLFHLISQKNKIAVANIKATGITFSIPFKIYKLISAIENPDKNPAITGNVINKIPRLTLYLIHQQRHTYHKGKSHNSWYIHLKTSENETTHKAAQTLWVYYMFVFFFYQITVSYIVYTSSLYFLWTLSAAVWYNWMRYFRGSVIYPPTLNAATNFQVTGCFPKE
mgnify:CR=1 FL=1